MISSEGEQGSVVIIYPDELVRCIYHKHRFFSLFCVRQLKAVPIESLKPPGPVPQLWPFTSYKYL